MINHLFGGNLASRKACKKFQVWTYRIAFEAFVGLKIKRAAFLLINRAYRSKDASTGFASAFQMDAFIKFALYKLFNGIVVGRICCLVVVLVWAGWQFVCLENLSSCEMVSQDVRAKIWGALFKAERCSFRIAQCSFRSLACSRHTKTLYLNWRSWKNSGVLRKNLRKLEERKTKHRKSDGKTKRRQQWVRNSLWAFLKIVG